MSFFNWWNYSSLVARAARLLAIQREPPPCDHKHWSWKEHGRRCTCGATMADFGD